MVGFTENVKIVSRNNAIHHFDTFGLSISIQIHFYIIYCYIKEWIVILRPNLTPLLYLNRPDFQNRQKYPVLLL